MLSALAEMKRQPPGEREKKTEGGLGTVLVTMCVAVKDFFRDVYMPVSDIIDLMALVNSAIHLGHYCTMSRQFRTCLTDSVDACVRWCRKGAEHAASDSTTLTQVGWPGDGLALG